MAINPRLRSMMDRSVDVKTTSNTQDAGGVSTPNYSTVFAGEPCSIWPASNEIVESYHRRDIIVSHQIAFGRDLALTAKHKIVEGSVSYLVKGINKFQNTQVASATVYVVDVEQRIN